MAWFIPDPQPLKAPQGVHLALSVGIPFLFIALCLWWVLGRTPSWPEALGLLYASGLAFWAAWRVRSRQGPLLKLWIWVVATLALWVGQSLVGGQPWTGVFALEGTHGIWFCVAFVQGQLTAVWSGELASRARLFQLIEGFSEGRVLEERVREFQLDADFSRGQQATLSVSLAVMGCLAVGLVAFSPARHPGVSVALLAGFLILCLLVGVLLRTYRREMEALMYGRRFTWGDKVAPLGWSFLLAVLAALSAWGLMGLGGPWLDLPRLLAGQPVASPPPAPTPPPLPPAVSSGDDWLVVLLALLGLIFQLKHIGAVFDFLFLLVCWGLPLAALAFLVWPLVRWFLSGGRETRGLLRRWWLLLRAQVLTFLDAWARWWRGTPEGADQPLSLGSAGVRDWVQSLWGRRVRGRRPYPEVVEAFRKLVAWAEPLLVYQKGETTREFLDKLAERLPEHRPDLNLVRDLLDQELFGRPGLDPSQRQRFLALVSALIAAPSSHDPAAGVS